MGEGLPTPGDGAHPGTLCADLPALSHLSLSLFSRVAHNLVCHSPSPASALGLHTLWSLGTCTGQALPSLSIQTYTRFGATRWLPGVADRATVPGHPITAGRPCWLRPGAFPVLEAAGGGLWGNVSVRDLTSHPESSGKHWGHPPQQAHQHHPPVAAPKIGVTAQGRCACAWRAGGGAPGHLGSPHCQAHAAHILRPGHPPAPISFLLTILSLYLFTPRLCGRRKQSQSLGKPVMSVLSLPPHHTRMRGLLSPPPFYRWGD